MLIVGFGSVGTIVIHFDSWSATCEWFIYGKFSEIGEILKKGKFRADSHRITWAPLHK